MRIWLFRKSAPQWGALLPTHWFSGWENSTQPDANAPSAEVAIRVGVGWSIETNLVLIPTDNPCHPWEIILKKHRVTLFF